MAVNLPAPDPAQLLPVAGIELGVARAGIRKPDRKDMLIVRLAPGTTLAGVFTRNRFPAAPVLLAKKHLGGAVRALVVNTGNANAGTGRDGLKRALEVCEAVAAAVGCKAPQVLPFSTGVIMEPLPVDRVAAGVPAAGLITGLGVDLIDSSFNRDQEREADAQSIDYLIATHYDPKAAIAMQEKFLTLDSRAHLSFLSSHPSSAERIQNLRALIQSKTERSTPSSAP